MNTRILVFLCFFNFAQSTINCNLRLDYSYNQNGCPVYNFDNCKNPEVPPSCPILEVNNRYPCPRYICEKKKDKIPIISKNGELTEKLSKNELLETTHKDEQENSKTESFLHDLLAKIEVEINRNSYRKNESDVRSTTESTTTLFAKLGFSSTFSNSNLEMVSINWIILFVCIAILAIVIVILIISTICYKNCKTWKVWNLCFRFCVAYFWNKRYTWFCNENNQDRHGFFNINDQSEHAYLNNNESLEFRRLETNLFVNYQQQQQRNEEAEDVIFSLPNVTENVSTSLNVQSEHPFLLLTPLSEELSESSFDEAEKSDKDYRPTCKVEVSPVRRRSTRFIKRPSYCNCD